MLQQRLHLPFAPSDEQTDIIMYPVNQPLLVKAGAGSGKSTTMSIKMLYNVVNGDLEPYEILGLTFTNKAVAELLYKVRQDFATVAKFTQNSSIKQPNFTHLPQIQSYNSFASDIITQYGAFEGIDPSARVITEADRYLLAKEAFQIWFNANQAAGEVLLNGSTDTENDEDIAKLNDSAIAENVLRLIDDIQNNFCSIAEVTDFIDDLLTNFHYLRPVRRKDCPECVENVSYDDPHSAWHNGTVPNHKNMLIALGIDPKGFEAGTKPELVIPSLQKRKILLEVAQIFKDLKSRRNLLDFGDQIALAYQIVANNPEISTKYRTKYKSVILDEYQDTSASQVKLLLTVFGKGHPIVAVGDPNQAIYEWRGASLDGILRFNEQFGGETRQLLTTRRNKKNILDVANRITAELTDADGNYVVDPLITDGSSDPGEVKVVVCGRETAGLDDNSADIGVAQFGGGTESDIAELVELPVETDEVVAYLQKNFMQYNENVELQNNLRPDDIPPKKRTAAILAPIRDDFITYKNALDAAGIPCEVAGLGGLLELPEIQDLCALLLVISSDTKDDMMMRILTSPKIFISRSELKVLTSSITHSSNSNNNERPHCHPELDSGSTNQLKGEDNTTLTTIILNHLPELKQQLGKGYARLALLAQRLNYLRSMQNQHSVGIFVQMVIGEFGLFEELKTYARFNDLPENNLLKPLQSFITVASDYMEYSDLPSLGGFLDYLEVARTKENGLDNPIGSIDKNAVQIITIHGAKGLEWDVVCAVSNTVKQYFRSTTGLKSLLEQYPDFTPSPGQNWLTAPTKLPDALRLDVTSHLPLVDLTNPNYTVNGNLIGKIDDKWKFDYVLTAFEQAESQRRLDERRRLAYVAFTRAKSHLLITGSLFIRYQNGIKAPTFISPFMTEALEVSGQNTDDLMQKIQSIFQSTLDPESENSLQQIAQKQKRLWPDYKELRAQNPYYQATYDLTTALKSAQPLEIAELPTDLQALIKENEQKLYRAQNWHKFIEIPQTLSTSATVRLMESPLDYLKQLVRPVPEKPQFAGVIGTRFHAFVEDFYNSVAFTEHCKGTYTYESDNQPENHSIDQYVQNFLRSRWSKLQPLEIEKEVRFIQNGRTIIARIDAIFADPDTADDVIIIDWKTGSVPKSEQMRSKAVQLAQYHDAYVKLKVIPLEKVRAGFVYVKNSPVEEHIFTADELGDIAGELSDFMGQFGQ